MKVGDLVTLSASGRKTGFIERDHKTFFRSAASSYWQLCAADRAKFQDYWHNGQVVGMVAQVVSSPGDQYDQHTGRYINKETLSYYIVWQADPTPMRQIRHGRNHLKFISKAVRK